MVVYYIIFICTVRFVNKQTKDVTDYIIINININILNYIDYVMMVFVKMFISLILILLSNNKEIQNSTSIGYSLLSWKIYINDYKYTMYILRKLIISVLKRDQY